MLSTTSFPERLDTIRSGVVDPILAKRFLHAGPAHSLPGAHVVLVAVIGDGRTFDQFHHEEGSPHLRRAGIVDLGNTRVRHHRERLTLGLEPGDDLLGAHAELDDRLLKTVE